MTQTELAAVLGLHQSQISRYARRGMPVDTPEAALAWMASHLRLTTRSPLARRQTTARRPSPPPAHSPAELWQVATDIIRLLADCDGQDFVIGCEHLRCVILRMPEPMQMQVRLPERIWHHLVGETS